MIDKSAKYWCHRDEFSDSLAESFDEVSTEKSSHRMSYNDRAFIESILVSVEKRELCLEVGSIVPWKLCHDDFVSDLLELRLQVSHPVPLSAILSIIPTMEKECCRLVVQVILSMILFCELLSLIKSLYKISSSYLFSEYYSDNHIPIEEVSYSIRVIYQI